MKLHHPVLVRFGSALLAVATVALSARADYQSTVLSQNPAAYYRLNETAPPPPPVNVTNSGSVGLAGNGTYNSAIRGVTPGAIVSEPTSASVHLVGATANEVRIPYQPQWNTAGPFSVEFWVKPDRTIIPVNGIQCLAANVEFIATTPVATRNGWLLYQANAGLTDGNGFVLRLYNSTALNGFTGVSASMPLDTNTWYHVVGTFDGTTIKLYTNGVLGGSAAISGTFRQNANSAIPLTFGARADGVSGYYESAASFDESAYYTTVLSAAQVMAHYQAGTNAAPGTAYKNVILADAPVGYWRYNEPADVIAANLGTLGSAANGTYQVGTTPGANGPRPATYSGFDAANHAVAVNGAAAGLGSGVALPTFNFNTNALTISCWVNASNLQQIAAGIVLCHSGSTYAGLTIDGSGADPSGGLGIGYVWNNDINTFNWSPSAHGSYGGAGPFLPVLPDSGWAYVALVIQPTEADVYLATTNGAGGVTFSSVTNIFNHVNQAFAGPTLIGTDATTNNFFGAIDEVGLWNRSLSMGELYTQFGSAVGGLGAKLFADLVSPAAPIVAGDPLMLTVNAGGTPNLIYQWWFSNSISGGSFAPIAGATNSTYLNNNFSIAANSGNYYVVVTNNYGTAISAVAVVTGQNPTPPAIVSGPSSRTIYPGGTLTMSVVATGGGLHYQWTHAGTNLPAATLASYIVASVSTNDAGSYTIIVTNTLGKITNGPAVVTVPNLLTGTYAQVVSAEGPEAWWRLDDVSAASGATLVDSMGRHDGIYTNQGGLTVGNAGAVAGGIAGTAAHFNGDRSAGIIPYFSALGGQNLSIEMWVKTTNTTASAASGSSFDLTTSSGCGVGSSSGRWVGNFGDGAGTLYTYGQVLGSQAPGVVGWDPTIYPNQWTHVVITYGGTGNANLPYQIYVNGVSDGYIHGLGAVPPLNPSAAFVIGGLGTNSSGLPLNAFNGSVDEVAVYRTVLTSAQILKHYQAAFFGVPPSFITQPQSKNVFAGDSVTFSATLAGTAPITVQWKKNGISLAGQTNYSITISNLYYTDSSDIYTLAATNSSGSALSSNAVATVYYPPAFLNITNGLVLHLPFDGNYNDTSGRGNLGLSTGTSFGAGKIGANSLFYETDTATNITSSSSNVIYSGSSYVDLGTGHGNAGDLVFGSTDSFSISLWVKVANGFVGGDVPFIGTAIGSMNNPGWDLGPSYGTGGWQWCLNDGVQTQAVTNNVDVSGPANSINDGNWHNFVLTVNRTSHLANAYLDGTVVGSQDITGLASLDNGQLVTIGQDPTYAYPGSFSGASATDLKAWSGPQTANLDDLGIWRRALTDYEARSVYMVGQNYGKSFDTTGSVSLQMTPVAGGKFGIAWQTGTLKQANKLEGPWTPVAGATPPFYQFTPGATNTFFRVTP